MIDSIKNGYLSPDGILYECTSFGHLDLAEELTEKISGGDFTYISPLECEEYLFKNGYICIRTRDVYGLIGYYIAPNEGKEERYHLTNAQKSYLDNLYTENINDSLRKSIDHMYEWDR